MSYDKIAAMTPERFAQELVLAAIRSDPAGSYPSKTPMQDAKKMAEALRDLFKENS